MAASDSDSRTVGEENIICQFRCGVRTNAPNPSPNRVFMPRQAFPSHLA